MNSNSNNDETYDIFTFLAEHLVENGKTHTHTSMCNPKGCYFIKTHELDTFYELCEQAYFNDIELHLTEKHEEISPMIIDIDFRYDYDTFERKHNIKHVKEIVELYVNEICSLFNVNIDDPRCVSFVFERKEMYKNKGFTKDGIHIIFPYIISYSPPQYYIRDNILKKIGDIISDFDLKNTTADVVDRAVISQNNWLLYGSNKDKPKGIPYELKYIIDGLGKEIEREKYFKDKDSNLMRFFSIRNKKISDLTPIQESKINVIESLTKKKIIKKTLSNISYDTNKIRELVSILNVERADNYNQWLEVGWMLHNIDPNSQELLDIWIDFSKSSSKFKDGECEKVWERSKNEGLSIATLHYWAKSDNYKKYAEFKSKDLDKYIDISVKTQTNYDIAYVLFKMYEYEYVYSDKNWYTYKNHRWRCESDGMSLRKLISDELCKKYFFVMSQYNKKASSSEGSDEEKEEYKKKGREVLEIVKKLKTTSFKQNTMTECQELFHEKDFVKKLDTNPYLIGFNNGVYDLNKCELRDGRPDDYIELNTEIDKIEFDQNNENWPDLEKFITTVFVDEEMRNYFMLYLASCLQGHNAEEKFRIWIGCGCHAINTPIMMSNGTIKNVQDITIGDKLMGDDSTERNVIELKRGFSDMYNITTIKGEEFIVNGDHVLCLKATTIGSLYNSVKEHRYKLLWQEKDNNGLPINKCKNFPYKHIDRKIYIKDIFYYENDDDAKINALKFKETLNENPNYIKNGTVIDIKVKDYLNIRDKIGHRNYFLYKVGIDFEKKDLPLDPYMVGYWLGDGTSQLHDNRFYQTLKNLNLLDNKHIPDIYKYNDINNRLNILAGIIDSDGHYQVKSNQYEITLKSEKLIDDVLYLARSLGFSCNKKNIKKSCQNFTGNYFNIIIYGAGIEDIPVLLERKKANPRIKNKNASYYGFNIKKVEDNYFYGFELDGNHRYLMGDFTVTHNSNGKSKILELFVHSYGNYTIKFPITLLTGKRPPSNACTPEVLQSKGKRFAYFEEPGDNEYINAGLLKEFTGGDKIKARGLHKDPVEFKPQFKIALLCNDIPKAPAYDSGYWRRVESIEFKSRFCDNPKESNEFPIDTHLSVKMKSWAELFMALLIDTYYVKYKTNGIKVPSEVIKYTLDYQRQCDTYTDFTIETIIETKLNSDNIEINGLYEEFRSWYENSFGGHKCPNKMEFKKYLKKKYGAKKVTSEFIKGFRLKTKEEKQDLINNPEKSIMGY